MQSCIAPLPNANDGMHQMPAAPWLYVAMLLCVRSIDWRRSFALGVVVLNLVEFARPDRLSCVSTNATLQTINSTYLALLVANILFEVL